MHGVAALLTIEEAQTRILERVRPLPPEEVPLAGAHGRVLADAASAAVDLPPFDSSAMDGYAVRAADLPGLLAVVGESAAGRPAALELRPGEAVAIATGAVVPDGADAVAPVEVVVQTDNSVDVPSLQRGAHIRPRGGDVRA